MSSTGGECPLIRLCGATSNSVVGWCAPRPRSRLDREGFRRPRRTGSDAAARGGCLAGFEVFPVAVGWTVTWRSHSWLPRRHRGTEARHLTRDLRTTQRLGKALHRQQGESSASRSARPRCKPLSNVGQCLVRIQGLDLSSVQSVRTRQNLIVPRGFDCFSSFGWFQAAEQFDGQQLSFGIAEVQSLLTDFCDGHDFTNARVQNYGTLTNRCHDTGGVDRSQGVIEWPA